MSIPIYTVVFAFFVSQVQGQKPSVNTAILQSIAEMPKGGGYAVNLAAAKGLRVSNAVRDQGLLIKPEFAQPSYCSGATYLVFLKTIQDLHQKGNIRLREADMEALLVKGEADGTGIWGRWNANGPGTAKLFHDLQLGSSFEDVSLADRGDFLKIFWKDAIGKKEFGHLVVYLSKRQDEDGQWWIRFWSSNQPEGYSEKEVKAERIQWAIFTRFQVPMNLSQISTLPQSDSFLADMLKKDFSRDQVRKAVGMKGKAIDGPWSKSLGQFSANPSGSAAVDFKKSAVIFDEEQTKNSDAEISGTIELRVLYHSVVQGDTLESIARSYNLSVEKLKSLNQLTEASIKNGQQLQVSE